MTSAADGEEALIKAQSERPDLVILDWLMPRLNGLETAKMLRETSPVPILMLTARDAVEQRVEGLNSGADDYLVKPFAPEDLPHIFERFYRSDESRTGSGAGLGLAIAQELIEAQYGQITVESEIGKGSTLTVTLPLA